MSNNPKNILSRALNNNNPLWKSKLKKYAFKSQTNKPQKKRPALPNNIQNKISKIQRIGNAVNEIIPKENRRYFPPNGRNALVQLYAKRPNKINNVIRYAKSRPMFTSNKVFPESLNSDTSYNNLQRFGRYARGISLSHRILPHIKLIINQSQQIKFARLNKPTQKKILDLLSELYKLNSRSNWQMGEQNNKNRAQRLVVKYMIYLGGTRTQLSDILKKLEPDTKNINRLSLNELRKRLHNKNINKIRILLDDEHGLMNKWMYLNRKNWYKARGNTDALKLELNGIQTKLKRAIERGNQKAVNFYTMMYKAMK